MSLFIIKYFKRNTTLSFFSILIVYLLAGIIYSISLGNNLRFPDEHVYYTLAGNLANSFHYSLDGKTLTACNPPGYPFFLAFLRFFGCNIILLRIANFILLFLAFLLVFRLLSKKVNEFSGLIFLLLIIIYPVIFYLHIRKYRVLVNTKMLCNYTSFYRPWQTFFVLFKIIPN